MQIENWRKKEKVSGNQTGTITSSLPRGGGELFHIQTSSRLVPGWWVPRSTEKQLVPLGTKHWKGWVYKNILSIHLVPWLLSVGKGGYIKMPHNTLCTICQKVSINFYCYVSHYQICLKQRLEVGTPASQSAHHIRRILL